MKNKLFTKSVYFAVALTSVFQACAQSNKMTPDTVSYQELYRPQYHLTSARGALFDPTALIYLDGTYIVNKGVAKGTDLVHWKIGMPKRLRNDTVREMSGSAVIDSFNTSGFGKNGDAPLVAVYSGLRTRDRRQFQCIAYSNDKGASWTAYEGNPVIDIGSTEFRDPQVFWYTKERKWVMVVALAEARKVRFYESGDLKKWTFLSDFGPFGAKNGVWECPDIFRLPVKGLPGTYKWVLEVSVQPIGGQYFVGEFDGKKFIADPDFTMAGTSARIPAGKVLFDFENGLSGWKTEGNAFSHSPATGSLPNQNPVLGFLGRQLLNSFYPGDGGTGKATSPEFTIDRPFLNFLIGGGLHEQTIALNLVVNGNAVRTISGTDAEVLNWSGWDVRDLKGKTAHLEVVDNETGGFGHIMLDEVILGDQMAHSEREPAFWLDYGPDFYAVRSWVNGPAGNARRISIAWLGSWLYATKVPTSPWKGGHTFPRSVELQKFPEGIRLIQNPVAEITKLRRKHEHYQNLTANQLASQIQKLNLSKNVYELTAEIEVGKNAAFEIGLCANTKQKTLVHYDVASQLLSVDRAQSGKTDFSPSFPQRYSAILKPKQNRIKLHILVDQSSIEVFGNDGEVNLTCQIFPDPDGKNIGITAAQGNVKFINFDLWELNSIWTTKN